ncbi:MFS transporter [Rhodococcus rhodochrous]|uniref:Putative proline/betaine transporter n=1 Tax=Rhodococcus rhodochrous KG-21 TaxID=1441923 RepID=A0A0M9WQV4_RHORH|nr:MFS transporter [Rhodococcus rhodochrous]KOS58211.1 major facilitator transporter [Rhodococcus rhodochrous KG-21]
MSNRGPKDVSQTDSVGVASSDPASKVSESTARRAAVAGFAGTIVEYYDFAVYGLVAAVLAPQFFGSENPTVALLASLAVFGTAYVARPLGGVVFGHLGDRYGRRSILMATILVMGTCSVLIGLLPTIDHIGIFAPILLILLRLGQGFAAGGELMGAVALVLESTRRGRRGMQTSITQMGATLGFAVAAVVVGVVTSLTTANEMEAWGWRIPFLLCLPLTLVCLRLRMRLEDSPEFTEMVANAEVEKTPLIDAVRRHPGAIIRSAAFTIATTGASHVGLVYIAVLLTRTLGFDSRSVYWVTAVVVAVAAAATPVWGALSDRIGRRPVMIIAAVGTGVVVYPVLWAMSATTSLIVIGIVYFVYMLFTQAFAPGLTAVSEMFPRRVRYSGSALGYNAGIVLGGAFAPYMSAQLVESTGSPLSPAILIVVVCVIGLAAAVTVKETATAELAK